MTHVEPTLAAPSSRACSLARGAGKPNRLVLCGGDKEKVESVQKKHEGHEDASSDACISFHNYLHLLLSLSSLPLLRTGRAEKD
jgi:hypothetical protein